MLNVRLIETCHLHKNNKHHDIDNYELTCRSPLLQKPIVSSNNILS